MRFILNNLNDKENLTCMMKLNLIGRVANTNLPLTHALNPLFEAVANSMDAIQEENIKNGYIRIHVKRDTTQANLPSMENCPIKSLEITDNGVGFTEENFVSFTTSDSRHKIDKGAKGIGRFLWLKAFEEVLVCSVFAKNGKFYERKFVFNLSEKGIEEEKLVEVDHSTRETTITLKSFKKDYQERCSKSITTIANKLIEHCLIYFLSDNCPQITVSDDNDSINLNEIYKKEISCHITNESLNIKNKIFIISALRLLESKERQHSIYLCANGREVISRNISEDIPNLHQKLRDNNGNSYVFLVYVSSKYLDESVNPERTSFNLIPKTPLEFPDIVSFEDILKSVIEQTKKYLANDLNLVQQEKIKRIADFSKDNPQYKLLIKYYPDKLELIKPNITNEKLDLELHKVYSQIKTELKEQGEKLLKIEVNQINDITSYHEELSKVVSSITEFSQAELACYVAERKLILKLFEDMLKKLANEKYQKESQIHDIIFPRNSTSDDIEYENHNLWIIDERLAYHKYLASDKELNKLDFVEVDSTKSPDIVIFNERRAFSEGEDPFDSIVIIEFKRPMKSDYAETQNPITQVIGYIRALQEGRAKNKDGRPVSLKNNARFYVYIVCDIVNKIKEFAANFDMKALPDGESEGFFRYHEKFNAYIEIISYAKLIRHAKQRNRVFFEKLNLPET